MRVMSLKIKLSYVFDHNINYIKQKKFDKIFMCCSPSTTTTPEAITAYKITEKLVNNKIILSNK